MTDQERLGMQIEGLKAIYPGLSAHERADLISAGHALMVAINGNTNGHADANSA